MSDQNEAAPAAATRSKLRALRQIVATVAFLAALAAAIGIVVARSPLEHSNVLSPRFERLLFYVRVFQLQAGLFALAAGAVAVAMRVAWKRSATSVAIALALLWPYAREYAPKRPPEAIGPTLRVLSMNLFAYNRDVPRIRAAIESADADVIVACEVTSFTQREVFDKLRAAYPFAFHPNYDGGAYVMSRVPIRPDRAGAGPRRPLLVELGGTTVAIYPVHLVSPGSAGHLAANRTQTAELADIARRELRPMIVVGDCNFGPTTEQYAQLCDAGLRTTQDLIGFGVGNTWGPKWWPTLNRLPGVRIDQMFLSRELTATSHRVGPYTGSDHRPIIADVALAKPRAVQ